MCDVAHDDPRCARKSLLTNGWGLFKIDIDILLSSSRQAARQLLKPTCLYSIDGPLWKGMFDQITI